jgi:hypothetical protein
VAYAFGRSGSTWAQQQELTASNGAAGDYFGSSVAVSGDTAIVGANRKASRQGAVYAFVGPLSNGETCSTAAQCLSGSCVDGVCCDTPCGGDNLYDCQVCSKARGASADGTCTLVKNACKAPDTCHSDGTCDPATGTCSYPEKPCASLSADQTPIVPDDLKRCEHDDDCEDAPKGHKTCSVEHVCCDEPCKGKCMSCRVAGHEGTCTDETYVDFKYDCAPKGYCLRTCYGRDNCVQFNGETQCAAPECSDANHGRESASCPANGEDVCPLSERKVFDCGRYACAQELGLCQKRCASVKDCAPSSVCNHNGECVDPPGPIVGSEPACAFAPASPASAGAQGALAALALAALLRPRRSLRPRGAGSRAVAT